MTTILITDDKINQLFIDNINCSEKSLKEAKQLKVKDLLKDGKKLIIEEMIRFFRENKSDNLGIYKGINGDNFIEQFTSFIESDSEESKKIIKEIKAIIDTQISNNDELINLIIKNRSINKNTIDFS